jgi:hypothetical protein
VAPPFYGTRMLSSIQSSFSVRDSSNPMLKMRRASMAESVSSRANFTKHAGANEKLMRSADVERSPGGFGESGVTGRTKLEVAPQLRLTRSSAAN